MSNLRLPQHLLWLVVGIVGSFLVLPSILMIAASFSTGEAITFPPRGFTLRWYVQMLADPAIRTAFANSLVVAAVTTLVGTIAGTMAALGLMKHKIFWRAGVEFYLLLPFIIPLAVEAVGLLDIYGAADLLGQRWAIGVAVAAANVPFVIATVSASVNRLDPNLEDAAASCGARPIERFLTMTIPAVMPGIISGGLILFITGINEFIVSVFLVDVDSLTLPVKIFSAGRGSTTPVLAAIAAFYTVATVVTIIIVDRLAGIETFLKART